MFLLNSAVPCFAVLRFSAMLEACSKLFAKTRDRQVHLLPVLRYGAARDVVSFALKQRGQVLVRQRVTLVLGLDRILQDLLHFARAHLFALIIREAFAEEELQQDRAVV